VVDSAYCPQCLSFHDVGTAASLGFCSRPTCKRCPICTAVAVVAVLLDDQDSKIAGYKCGYCSWSSKECNVTVEITPGDDGSIGKPQLVKAAEELGNLLKDRIVAQNASAETHHQAMLHAWEAVAKEEVRRGITGMTGSKMKKATLSQEDWSIEALEESIRDKRRALLKESCSVVGGRELQTISLKEDEPTISLDESMNDLSKTSLSLQSLNTFTAPTSRSELLPLPIPLRPRKSRRCRAELAEGRPGILVKPKLNPLEGDSSLRTGHGQWWKKDSSAIHVLPRLRVVKHQQTASGDVHSFLLKVTNPTLGLIRMRFSPSQYDGEAGDSGKETVLKHVLLDSLELVFANISVDFAIASTIDATEMIELESMEDALLEIGKSQTGVIPDAVASWTPPGEGSASAVRVVATKRDSAWVEFVVVGGASDSIGAAEVSRQTVPLAMDIQVGEGSWESSLIKPREDVKGPDLVRFDVLVVSPNVSTATS
jgi:dynactin-4